MHRTIREIDLPGEIAGGDSLRLIDLARRFKVCISTCFRWIVKGLPTGNGSRVKLEALKRGKCWFTSEAAVKRFFAALPKSEPTPAAAPMRTPCKFKRDNARAEQALEDRHGF
jgi:hypothetical protein